MSYLTNDDRAFLKPFRENIERKIEQDNLSPYRGLAIGLALGYLVGLGLELEQISAGFYTGVIAGATIGTLIDFGFTYGVGELRKKELRRLSYL